MEYTILIGEYTEITDKGGKTDYNIKIDITRSTFNFIESFSDIKRDKNMNKIYVINNIEFRVIPRIGIHSPVEERNDKQVMQAIFRSTAEERMKDFKEEEFRKSHETLYEVILLSMKKTREML